MTRPIAYKAPHDRAMALCDEADVAWRLDLFADAERLFAEALPLEREAIRRWNGKAWWRRVLRRSLKSIAWCMRLAGRRVPRSVARKAEGR